MDRGGIPLKMIMELLGREGIERRGYQLWVIGTILQAMNEGKNIILELDAGMGKRVISYILCRILPKEKILIVTPSRASVSDMALFFKDKSGSDEWFGTIIGGMPRRFKTWIVRNRRVVISTPISLMHALEKEPQLCRDISVVIINEVDKVLRRVPRDSPYGRQSSAGCGVLFKLDPEHVLVHPWGKLRLILPSRACWIGMSGTLRDQHYILTSEGVHSRDELRTVVEALFPKKPVVIITMDMLIERTDAMSYVLRNITLIRPLPIHDEKVKIIVDCISRELDEVTEKIRERYCRLYVEDAIPARVREKIHRTISLLPNNNPLRVKFLRLALARRHILANTPDVYRKFLAKPMFRRIIMKYSGMDLRDVLPNESSKLDKIVEIVERWVNMNQSIVVVLSFVKTAIALWTKLKNKQVPNVHILTGRTYNKRAVIESFKKKKPSVLILTPVAERDLDFPEASLVIIHDIISTVKSMYQRIKRARRSTVVITYYSNTYEEKKVKILLSRMIRRYPWSIRIGRGDL